jgi:hypothetical protein
MRTDQLIAMLAAQAGPVEPGATQRRFATALGWGLFVSMLGMALALGVREDIAQAALLPMFWVKLLFPAAVGIGALYAAARLARPGMRLGILAALPLAAIGGLWLIAALSLFAAAPQDRAQLIFGETWFSCPISITLLALPVLVAAFWAIKGLAPTRLAFAGAAAGLLAGAAGAAVYALHCPEMTAPFLAIWYVLGMAIPAVIGALAAPRLLRW